MMNTRLILFSGIMMALLGSVFGLAVSKMHQHRYQCCGDLTQIEDLGYSRSRTPGRYGAVGAAMGFGVGSILETLRQAQPEENQD